MPIKKKFTFIALPHYVVNHADFISLSANAVKLLIDIANQYRGHNNGDLCVAFSVMQKRGWKSKSNLLKATKELLEKKFIVLTRQGGRKTPNLYAITWKAIDECDNKLDSFILSIDRKRPPRTFNDKLDAFKKSLNSKQ